MRKLFTLVLFLLLISQAVNAEVIVRYDLKEGKIDSSNNFQTTNVPLTNANAVGYVCLDANCEQLGNKLFIGKKIVDGNIIVTDYLSSGNNSFIQATYPTELQSQFGYAVYFYKNGYIPWEVKSNWHNYNDIGPNGEIVPVTRDAYLSKQEFCKADIDEFTIRNSERINTPVVVSVSAKANAEIMSAITEGTGPLKTIPEELKEHYSVKTLVVLDILNELNERVYSANELVNVKFGETEDAEFTFIPNLPGDYKAKVKTQVIDEKCLNSLDETKEQDFFVLEEYSENKCYTELGFLDMPNFGLRPGEELRFNFNKLSNLQINSQEDNIEAIPTYLKAKLIERGFIFDNVILEQEFELIKNENSVDPQQIDLSLTLPEDIEEGYYDLVLTGKGNDARCEQDNKEDVEIGEMFITEDIDSKPAIISQPVRTAILGTNYIYDVEAIDAENEELTYSFASIVFDGIFPSFSKIPKGMTIENQTGLIKWLVDKNSFKEGDNFKIIVEVTDSAGNTAHQIFTITVVNDGIVVEEKIKRKHDLKFTGLELETSNNLEGINGLVQIKNSGEFKENNLLITADIYELGVHEVLSTNINLGQSDSTWIPINLEIPRNTKDGEYLLHIRASSTRHTEENTIIIFIEDDK